MVKEEMALKDNSIFPPDAIFQQSRKVCVSEVECFKRNIPVKLFESDLGLRRRFQSKIFIIVLVVIFVHCSGTISAILVGDIIVNMQLKLL